MNTRTLTAGLTMLLATVVLTARPLQAADEGAAAEAPPAAGSYHDYMEAVRAQRQARLAERHRKLRAEAENRRQLGEARRQAMNDMARRHLQTPVPGGDPKGSWPGSGMPSYWDNSWYYRGY